MDLTERLLAAPGPSDPDVCWAASGAMALTGRPDARPLLAPRSVTDTLVRLAGRLDALTGHLGEAVPVDGPALLGERAALSGATRRGTTSVGGATRLLRARDGWVAVALARPWDLEVLPAWLGIEADPDDPWPAVAAALAERPRSGSVAEAAQLGVPCAALGETPAGPLALAQHHGDAAATAGLGDVVVADLSSLWAGPLCADLLARAGATVMTIESAQRPDGSRSGDPAFYALLHGGGAPTVVDLSGTAGRRALIELLRGADVVIEAARPRALAQLGVDAADVLARGRTRVWCGITGHGRAGAAGERVGFGDDAAVAGGLVAYDAAGPVFCADAAADPATGLTAAVAVLDRLAAGDRWLLDVSLARTAAVLAGGPTTRRPWHGDVAPPRTRRPR